MHLLVSGALVAVVVTAGWLVGGTSPASPASTGSSNVVPYGDAGVFGSLDGVRLARPIVGMAASPSGLGYWLVGSDGGVFTFGDAAFYGSRGGVRLARPVVGMAAFSHDPPNYSLVGADGGVFTFGYAGFFGSLGGVRLASPIVGMAMSPRSDRGYWLVASDGGVFTFGQAGHLGSLREVRLARPIVGMATSPSGLGYWLVGADGGVFAFGDAGFFGSRGGAKLARPIFGMAASPSGHGYWLVGADGGVFTFGDAGFFGSLGGAKLASPIVAMAPSPSGHGYWLAGSDGHVFAFGDAGLRRREYPPYPTTPGTQLPSRIIPNFKPPVPGAPVISAQLDDTGLHFNPSHITSGVYNVAFSDTRTTRTPGLEIALHIYVTGPGYSMLSVHAGETGGGLLCWGAVSEGVTVNGYDLTSGGLTIDPSPACQTPVT